MNRTFALLATILGALLLGLLLGPRLSAPGNAREATGPAGLPPVAEVATRVGPSVVSVTAETLVLDETLSLEELRYLAQGLDKEEDHTSPPPRGKETRGGTGLVFDREGHVVTNYHVVQGAHRIRVEVVGHAPVPAEIVGSDPETDLALLRIHAPFPLEPARLADSDRVRVGEWVLAIGDPLTFQRTVTVGIVSGTGRRLGDGLMTDYIQTDAAINVGNSGGPLLNLQGEVIGINTAISRLSSSARYQTIVEGVGFAIPSNTVRRVADQLRQEGRVARGFLGVEIEDLSQEAAEALGVADPAGALVLSVRADCPAARAGLVRGDVIRDVQGREVVSANDLIQRIAGLRPGSKVTLGVHRAQEGDRTVHVELMDRDDVPAIRMRRAAEPPPWVPLEDGVGARVGIEVRDPRPEEGEGAVVERVDPMSRAWDEGVRPGSRIVQVQGDAVNDADGFTHALSGVGAGEVARFLVSTGDWGPSDRLVFLRAR